MDEDGSRIRWKAVGAEIRRAREAKGLTGRAAERLHPGIRQAKLSQAERAVRNHIPYEELRTYALAFDMDLDVLALMAYGQTRPAPGSSIRRTA